MKTETGSSPEGAPLTVPETAAHLVLMTILNGPAVSGRTSKLKGDISWSPSDTEWKKALIPSTQSCHRPGMRPREAKAPLALGFADAPPLGTPSCCRNRI